jgi:mannose/fructose/N-acetylgalactosamine-specific phosphotransferase system component IIB
MAIEFLRIDDRFIHAQITWGWTPILKPTQVVVVNDEVANDEYRKKVLLIAADPIMSYSKIKMLSLKEAIADPSLRENSQEKTLMIVDKPVDVVFLIRNGIVIKNVSLGWMSERPGKTKMLKTVSIDNEDIQAFRELVDMGVDVKYQTTPSDTPIDVKEWMPGSKK